MNEPNYLLIIIVLAVPLVLFLIFRSIMLWYWKVDTIVENQEKQIALLTDLLRIYKKVNNYPE
jgi:hypothetical protein